ncbi:15596_t:CDS:10 [Dentiscutata erythropus]|uniref:15596_t:CDS:1 n=1 Tax=Dentiscutata erythropus TaxID=1348616 RepID=A0A9N8VBL3_9GLOM|nr:15596_t:CDS:10 [Dentiscutata erythropus]
MLHKFPPRGFDITPKANKDTIAYVYDKLALQNGFNAVFDGNTSIYSVSPLNLENEKGGNHFEIHISQSDSIRVRNGTYKVVIRFVQKLSFDELQNYVSGRNASAGEVIKCIMALNAFINFTVRRNYPAIGKSIFPNPKQIAHSDLELNPIILPGALELRRGFYQSLRPVWNTLAINVDICASVFYLGGPFLDVAARLLNKRNTDEFRQGLQSRDWTILSKFVRRLKIRTIHRGQRRPVYMVRKLSTEPADRLYFKINEANVSVAEYFFRTYNRRLSFENLPCLLVKNDVYLPLEVCDILPGQRFDGQLADLAHADMIKHTCIKPAERFNRISKAVKEIFKHNRDPHINSIGMDVDGENMTIDGRVLTPPTVEFNSKSVNQTHVPKDGRWNLVNKIVVQGKSLENWSVLVFGTRVPEQSIDQFMRQFRETASQKGLTGPLYGEIKRVGDTILGVPTQVLLSKLITKQRGLDQVCANISLKVNVKLGGKNSLLSRGQLNFVSQVPTMIFGADVFHPGRGERKPSVAAVCASMDIDAIVYSGRYSVNKVPRNETIESLEDMVNDLFRAFWERNKSLPNRILFYRDGVSEGQFQHVLNIEVKAIKAVISRCYKPESEPTLTFIIVQKRHHTRFMPENPRDGDRLGNCIPGTVVDNSIAVPHEFDFFLQSHYCLQGTARPIHYNVLYDEHNFSADEIQTLTYRLCYLSARCTLSISLVPPVYYAHLIANRARHYLKWEEESSEISGASISSISDVKDVLQNSMFFI